MKVKTRNGGIENINFNKIKDKLDYLVELNNLKNVEPDLVAKETVAHIYDGISTTELDDHSANIAASFATIHPEYLKLAGSIVVSSIHKETSESCYESWMKLTKLTDKNGNNYSILNDTFLELIEKYKTEIDSIIVHNRDYKLFDYFGIKTLTRSYLLKDNNGIVERPQYMFLRVAITVNMGDDFDFKKVLNTYNLLSQGYYIHATPTLYNAGTVNQQLASCFLLKTKADSIDGIFDTIKDCAQISKYAGGIGVSVHEVRGTGSIIRGTNGVSNGLRPMLQVFNQTARYVDQGGGKRKGSIAIYLEPWHCDIYDFLDLKTNVGDENSKARDLFLALWIPDLFMERVEKKQVWSLMSPDECLNLNKVYGEEFRQLYEKYEAEGKYRKQVNAVDLFKRIMEVQIETGIPYMCYKDAANIKSNQKNLGTIESSNLCVAGDTMILTSTGYFPIKELVNKCVNVWNGTQFSSTIIKKTGEDQKLITVKFNNGMTIKCTPYHKFYLENDFIIEAQNLTTGCKITTYNLPVIKKTNTNLNLNYTSNSTIVPINYSFDVKLKWLEDYTNDKGVFTDIDGVYNIVFSSENKQFLIDVFYLLQTLGCNTLINKKDNLYKLYIDNNSLCSLKNLGFNPRNNFTCYKINSNRNIKVTTIEDTDIFEDTYCFNEPLEHKGIFNGIITGQCSEIIEYSSPNEYSTCNLASINLTRFVKDTYFDFEMLRKVSQVATENLDRVISVNKYPCPETEVSNFKHRPIGLGVQGLADVFFLLKIPFDSMEARMLNEKIFETIYYGSIEASVHRAKHHGSYSSFNGSPFSEGKLQFDLWNAIIDDTVGNLSPTELSSRNNIGPLPSWDWNSLKSKVKKGMRNSLLTAVMPTASTSQILGNYECIEPQNSNIYVRKTIAGKFIVINKYLVNDLMKLNLWNEDMKDLIIYHNGSIQAIDTIPQNIKNIYKTVWELKQKVIVDLAVDRAKFIDQSQSMNIFMAEPDYNRLYSCHMYSWKKGLKTGSYYLRSRPSVNPIKFNLGTKFKEPVEETCEMCSA